MVEITTRNILSMSFMVVSIKRSRDFLPAPVLWLVFSSSGDEDHAFFLVLIGDDPADLWDVHFDVTACDVRGVGEKPCEDIFGFLACVT